MSVVGIVRFFKHIFWCDFNLKVIGKSLESWKLSDKLGNFIIWKIYSSYDRIDSWITRPFHGYIIRPLANSDTHALESIVLLTFHGSVTTAVLPIVTSWSPPNAFQLLRISVSCNSSLKNATHCHVFKYCVTYSLLTKLVASSSPGSFGYISYPMFIEHSCGVCREGVASNLIRCIECLRWVHKSCSDISGKLKSNTDFHCRRCLEDENDLFQSVLLKKVVIEPNVKWECIPKFYYLGDTLDTGDGVEEAARARVRCAWAKFKELPHILLGVHHTT